MAELTVMNSGFTSHHLVKTLEFGVLQALLLAYCVILTSDLTLASWLKPIKEIPENLLCVNTQCR